MTNCCDILRQAIFDQDPRPGSDRRVQHHFYLIFLHCISRAVLSAKLGGRLLFLPCAKAGTRTFELL
nr:MAG TPA: hypothetical protein [Caudoviricetes sp.]